MDSTPGAPKHIDAYIAGFPSDVQAILTKIRIAIQQAAPGATETIKYDMPTFVLNGNLIHFAAYTKHIGIYPAPAHVATLDNELAAHLGAKSTVRLPLSRPINYALVAEIVEARVKENLARAAKSGAP